MNYGKLIVLFNGDGYWLMGGHRGLACGLGLDISCVGEISSACKYSSSSFLVFLVIEI